MVDKINKLKNWQAALILLTVGLAVFFVGLKNPFQGDDLLQIVNNPPVHSISHINLLFEGGTFYSGKGLAPLSGTYYRPLMMAVFSLLYTVFGLHAVYFHLTQYFVCIGSSILLYLFFRYSFKPALALVLALVFLIHPLNSQIAFSIPNIQDALFFFFGILSLWILVRFHSARSLLLVALSLFLSMLAKETGLLFVVISLIYVFWWDKKRATLFSGLSIVALILWFVLRINAIGLDPHAVNAPIDKLSFTSRILNIPELLLFFISKVLFPWRLATEYYWTHQSLSFRYFFLPLFIDLLVASVVLYVTSLVRRKGSKSEVFTYMFFVIWAIIGLLPNLQIIPLDMTVSETWLYFSMAGILGMLGMAIVVIKPQLRIRVSPTWALLIVAILLSFLGARTIERGRDYRNQYVLASQNIIASPDDFYSYHVLASQLIQEGNLAQALLYTKHSLAIFPTYQSYTNLGVISVDDENYSTAFNAYVNTLKVETGPVEPVYEDLAILTLVYGKFEPDKQVILQGLNKYPSYSNLWLYLSFLEEIHNDNADAKISIAKAAQYGQVPQTLSAYIYKNKPFSINLVPLGKVVKI
jgi:hypothetical protein